MTIVQCLMEWPTEAGKRITVRWVSKKKAVLGATIIALGFDEMTENEWQIVEVYGLEQEDQWTDPKGQTHQCYFHVIK